MEIEQMESLVSTLEKGGVPASVAFLRFASLLHNNSKVAYGDVQGNPQNFIIAQGITSVKMGLGLDVGPAMAVHCKASIQGLITWMRSTGVDFKNGVANAPTMLYAEMGEHEWREAWSSLLSRKQFCLAAMKCSGATRTQSLGF